MNALLLHSFHVLAGTFGFELRFIFKQVQIFFHEYKPLTFMFFMVGVCATVYRVSLMLLTLSRPCSPTLGQVDWFSWTETCPRKERVWRYNKPKTKKETTVTIHSNTWVYFV